ncbi:pyrroline-5-carboxylate reductase [Romboutsia sedimentorum]|uniref:Pyrroline-5-carboxylate reductase n=1 Tax=Romboutsia sedimentorum TaxID=1368474 RepID=A0ABT7E7N5_9FIRM|nr:pyrroline-5-carboxylate reductase [Romboutsia sedimentorum]MDK2561966.1 pyrroline-5-carboxylate reductase [Romboutsia sedimentorum]MDK2586760.1 pyrroline-5-carboxylate reductase [Romboutsia sedimentorum]
MDKKIGFIGCGNMAKAIIGGMIKSKLVSSNNIIASALSDNTLQNVKNEFNINTTKDSREVIQKSDIIIVAVKPNIYDSVLNSVKDLIDNKKIIVTIAAGKTIASVENIIGNDKKIVRTMPNTPALVNEGMSAICKNKNITDQELNTIKTIFDSFGKSEVVLEYLIDAVIGVSGSAPAYVFMFIEAMADAAVAAGMPRSQAYKFASQAVMGSAKMVLESGKHPGELKDMVCSPGGTTIEAVKTLEAEGLRNSVIKGIEACIAKSKEMN